MATQAKTYPIVENAISLFCDWLNHRQEMREIRNMNNGDFARIARDLSVSPAELDAVVRRGPHEGTHTGMMRHGPRASTLAALLVAAALGPSCGAPTRASDTVVYASGADLESANPLVTVHPLSRQIQRFALLVTLARYDSALVPQPYLASRWDWNSGGDVLTLHLYSSLKWHDGQRTTARDVVFTIDAARDRATGYPRYGDLANITETRVIDDSTVQLRFSSAPPGFPPVLAELPILPAHLLATVPRSDMVRRRSASRDCLVVG